MMLLLLSSMMLLLKGEVNKFVLAGSVLREQLLGNETTLNHVVVLFANCWKKMKNLPPDVQNQNGEPEAGVKRTDQILVGTCLSF